MNGSRKLKRHGRGCRRHRNKFFRPTSSRFSWHVSLCSKIGKACYIPIGHKSSKCIKKDIVIKKLKPLLEDPSIKENRSKY